jgi:hypothetical protein
MVTMVGPKSPVFKASSSALSRIHRFFEDNFSVGDVRPYKCSSVADMDAIVAATRFLTPADCKAWPACEQELTAVIDPDKVLRSAVGTGSVRFTEDNVVSYWEMAKDRHTSE